MHLWPSMRIRDSFKHAYLEKLEWNTQRMNAKQKQQQNRSQSPATNHDKLLDATKNHNQGDDDVVLDSKNHAGGALALCRELIMLLSCCYCCFCCGACEEES